MGRKNRNRPHQGSRPSNARVQRAVDGKAAKSGQPSARPATKEEILVAQLAISRRTRKNELNRLTNELKKNSMLSDLLAQTQKQLEEATTQLANIAMGNDAEATNKNFEDAGLLGDDLSNELPGHEGQWMRVSKGGSPATKRPNAGPKPATEARDDEPIDDEEGDDEEFDEENNDAIPEDDDDAYEEGDEDDGGQN